MSDLEKVSMTLMSLVFFICLHFGKKSGKMNGRFVDFGK